MDRCRGQRAWRVVWMVVVLGTLTACDRAPSAVIAPTSHEVLLSDPELVWMVHDPITNRRQSVKAMSGIPSYLQSFMLVHKPGWPPGPSARGAYVVRLSDASSGPLVTARWHTRREILAGVFAVDHARHLGRTAAIGAENVALAQPTSARRARARAAIKVLSDAGVQAPTPDAKTTP